MKLPLNLRSAPAWRGLGVIVLVSGTIILASMGLVSFRNRNREASQAVQWAVEALRQVPEDTVGRAYIPAVFYKAVGEFHQAVHDNTLPVDSVRQFYQAYSLWARDGVITAQEVADLGPYLGLPAGIVSVTQPQDASPQSSDSTEVLPGE
jgi:hypothetical protein